MTLHTKYRPQTFDRVYGNEVVINTLQTMLKNNTLPNTILFHGPRGCGKTTLARIVADSLGCSEFGFMEFDTANTRGIDTARGIIQNLQFKAVDGSVKVFVLDEVHKTTNDFQNALLKATEEPPPHIYFILCTTEPKKIIEALRSRCTAFEVKSIKEKQIQSLIKDVAKTEGIKVSADVLDVLVEESEGRAREALILLNLIRDCKTVAEALKLIQNNEGEDKEVIDLCRALLKGSDWKTMSKILKGVKADPEKVRHAVLGYMTSVLLSKSSSKAAVVIECFEDNFYDSGRAGLVLACYRTLN
jgi:DNA polymerase-3 subunit gamma/tau